MHGDCMAAEYSQATQLGKPCQVVNALTAPAMGLSTSSAVVNTV
jgi:hypothetical protein